MSEENKFYGSFRGLVGDNQDPDFLGRVKVIVPALYGTDILDTWAWPKGMFAGKNAGFFAIPSVNDGIWVTFENGDARYPIWEYGWFGENDVPEAAKNNGNKPTNQLWQSYSGHMLEFDDKQGSEQVRITSKFGDKIVLNDKGISFVADKISAGGLDGSPEKAVKGDKLKTLLDNQFTALSSACDILVAFASTQAAICAAVPLSPLAGGFTVLGTGITTVKTSLETLAQTLETILSEVNTLK